jgi:hypothetical protein
MAAKLFIDFIEGIQKLHGEIILHYQIKPKSKISIEIIASVFHDNGINAPYGYFEGKIRQYLKYLRLDRKSLIMMGNRDTISEMEVNQSNLIYVLPGIDCYTPTFFTA